MIRLTPTEIPDVLLVEPRVFGDERGFFYESYNRRELASAGLDAEFVQDNHSRSARGVLRGLHYQIEHPQGKLVRVTAGEVFDVVVDMRKSSPGFGKWVGVKLSDFADFLYKTTDYWYPEFERTLLWSDPALAICWPIDGTPTLAAKDAVGQPLALADVYP